MSKTNSLHQDALLELEEAFISGRIPAETCRVQLRRLLSSPFEVSEHLDRLKETKYLLELERSQSNG